MNEQDRSFIQELLNKTTYIRYQELKQILFQSFELFKQSIGQQEFYLLLPAGKFGSEYWLVALLWSQIRNMNLRGIIKYTDNFQPQGLTNILVVDDAIYSGARMVEMFDNFIQNRQRGQLFNIHIVVPFITKNGTEYVLDTIKRYGSTGTIYDIKYLPSMYTMIDLESYYPDDQTHEDYEEYAWSLL
jgi:hypothetical protein